MRLEEIAQRRMNAHRLWSISKDTTNVETAADVLRFLVCMQAQEYPYARWSIAQRIQKKKRPSASTIDALLEDGTILRTHTLRPTWHFVLPEDIRWVMRLTGPRVHQLNAYYYRQCELDEKTLAKAHKVIAKAFEQDEDPASSKTRAELATILERGGVKNATKVPLAYILMHAELEELLVSGGLRGKQQTYALFESRVDAKRETKLEGEEALAALTKRFFLSRGPATLKDFARWSSLSIASIKKGIAAAGKSLATIEGEEDGVTYVIPAGQKAPAPPKTPRIDLVQGYDEAAISYSDSKHVLKPRATTMKLPRGIYTHAIFSNGQLVGHWKSHPKTTIETQLYRELTKIEKAALNEAIEEYAAFL